MKTYASRKYAWKIINKYDGRGCNCFFPGMCNVPDDAEEEVEIWKHTEEHIKYQIRRAAATLEFKVN